MVNNYIESIIDIHQEIHGIYFHNIHREYIKEQVNKGVYAFQVIYVDNSGSQTKEIKNLDYSLLKSKNIYEPGGEEFFNKLWSYDGKRFQWSDTETLVFDPSKIRDIKLDEIIK
jgi:hypothetical protein